MNPGIEKQNSVLKKMFEIRAFWGHLKYVIDENLNM